MESSVSLEIGNSCGFLFVRTIICWGILGHPQKSDPLVIYSLLLLTAEQVQAILMHRLYSLLPRSLSSLWWNKSEMDRKLLRYGGSQRSYKRGPSNLLLGVHFSCVIGSLVFSRERVDSIISSASQ